MLVARAFVLGLNARATLAVGIVALSVAYALLMGGAAAGLQRPDAIAPDLATPERGYALPGFAPFDASLAPPGAVVLTHTTWQGVVVGTVQPWPYAEEVVPGLYAPRDLPDLGLPVGAARADPHAPGDWVLLPPSHFAARFPALVGKATLAFAPQGGEVPGLASFAAPAAAPFLQAGAQQVRDSVHLVVVAVAGVVAVLAGGVLRLEVLARAQELATLEALGGARAARGSVVLRAAWLVGLGVGAGVALGVAGLRLAGRALGQPLQLDAVYFVEVAALAFLAGFAAGALGGLAGLRAPLATRLGRRGPSARPFPGPVRFLLVTPRAAPACFVAGLVLAAVVAVVLQAASVPVTVFHPEDGTQVVGQASGNPFRGNADRFFATHASLLPGVAAASAETVVPTIIHGRPVVVRGVDFDAWRAVDAPGLRAGRWPSAPGEAMVGVLAARLLGLGPGDEVLAPGAYRATAALLRVVGVHDGGGLREDEVLTDLDTAGSLAGLAPSQVHMARLRATPDAARAALSHDPVVVATLTLLPSHPVPHTLALARATLVNFDAEPRTKLVALRINDVLVASTRAEVPGHAEAAVLLPFRVPEGPELRAQVNPTANATAGESGLRVVAPERVAANTTFEVFVTDERGSARTRATVQAGAQRAETDGFGRVVLQAGPPGLLALDAAWEGEVGGATVYVVDPSWSLGPHVAAVEALVREVTPADATHLRVALEVTVANLGGASFDGTIEAFAGAEVVGAVDVRVGVAEQRTVALTALPPRDALALEVAGLAIALPPAPATGPSPEPPSAPQVRTVADVLRERRAALERSGGAKPLEGRAFIDDVFANLGGAVTLVVLATFLHTGAAVVVAVVREVRERGSVVRTLADLGATPDQLATRAARDALLSTLPGIALGAAVGLGALAALGGQGFPSAFGHAVPVRFDAGLYVRVVAALAFVAVVAAVWATRAGPERALRQAAPKPLGSLLEARA